jgi:hypothetical protein
VLSKSWEISVDRRTAALATSDAFTDIKTYGAKPTITRTLIKTNPTNRIGLFFER